MNKPTLWIMCGLSGSGKSTVATQIAENNENTVIVSSDAIREELTGNYEDQEHNEEVFRIFHNRIRKNLENKKNVIADATNLTMKSRRAILDKVNGLNIYRVCIIVPKPFEKCKEDNLHREHPVPDFVLDKQIRKFQIPFYEEEFDEINIHDLLNDYEPNDIPDMREFDQKNPHHTMDLFEHCKYTARLFTEKFSYHIGYKLGALYHDVGKVDTQSFDENGVAHYYNHDAVGSYLFLTAMYAIDGTDLVLKECFLINYHMLPFSWTSEEIKNRWRKRFGEHIYQMLLDFNRCDRAR